MHKVIIVTGLGDEVRKIEWATRFWRKYDLDPIVHSVGWRDTKETFAQKLEKLLNRIDQFSQLGYKISLVGTSAGGSAALNAFMQKKENISHVVNVCGRLRVGTHVGIHSFEARTASSPIFAQSVRTCETKLGNLTSEDRKKIMTMRPLCGDEAVPADTVTIEGAQNMTIPTGEHILSIALALTIFSKKLIDFITQ